MTFSSLFRDRFARRTPVDEYVVAAVTSTAALDRPECLPPDVRFVLAASPELRTPLQQLLKNGYGIGVRTVPRTPGRVLTAIDRIAERTQGNTVIPWLPTLLEKEEVPLFTREELEQAHADGVDLYEEARIIAEEREAFRKLVLIDLHDRRITEAHQAVLRQANDALVPFAVAAMVHRTVLDRSRTEARLGDTLAKAVFFIGPAAHLLERWVLGLGIVFAAVADDLLSETANAIALRQSGFTRRQLRKRIALLLPPLILGVILAWQVTPLLQAGKIAQAGALFGLAALMRPLMQVGQSIAMFRSAYAALIRDRKVLLLPGQSSWSLAIRQAFLDTSHVGSVMGMILMPAVATGAFLLAGVHVTNGWVLALVASADVIIAAMAVAVMRPLERWWFHRRALKQLLP